MRQFTQAVKDALWNGNVQRVYNLFTVYLAGGTQYWTNDKADVVYSGTTWTATAPTIKPPSGLSDTGLSADARDIEISGDFSISGQTVQQLALAGSFEQVRFVWEQGIATTGSIVGLVKKFDGLIIDAQPRTLTVKLRVKSATALLEQEVPGRLIALSCGFDFKGTDCGYAGAETACDHTTTRCTALSNRARFGGFRTMPRSEASE